MKVESRTEQTIPGQHPIANCLKPLIHGMCRHPVDIEDQTHGFTIIPHRADFRIVCGKRGRTIKALQAIASAAALRDGLWFDVKLEEGEGEPEPDSPFVQNIEFDVFGAERRIKEIAEMCGLLVDVITTVRVNDRMDVSIRVRTAAQEAILTAINDIFYPWGFRNGMIIKVKAVKP